MKPDIDYAVYLVTARTYLAGRDFYACIEAALKGGVTLVQLREKNLDLKGFLNLGENIKLLCDKYKVPLIINDNITASKLLNAAGVHLGQGDANIEAAREQLGDNAIIGISTHTVAEAVDAEKRGADYLGVGAIYPTGSKVDATLVGLQMLLAIKATVHIPIVGIGGIDESNYREVMNKGVAGCAMISGILAANNIEERVKTLINDCHNN
ncbi:MAG: thiamine phosphate synthase [Acidaminococcaceae bacterium]|nr:thiamine phosphate synthase [Acidaminococcaceae bacterium]MDD4721257.1 thiamine phosphate synthase [Acidaminococcaceae bacterium]